MSKPSRGNKVADDAHARRCVKEVLAWPDWKKAFAADVYSVPVSRFYPSKKKETKCQSPA